jgi:signal transduction histidine kinase
MHIIASNAAAERLPGYRGREFENVPVSSLFPEVISHNTQILRIAGSRHRILRQTDVRTVLVNRNLMQQHIHLFVDKTRNTWKNRSHILLVIIDDGDICRDLEYYKKANAKLHLLNSINRHDIANSITSVSGYNALLELDLDLQITDQNRYLLGQMNKALYQMWDRLLFSKKYENLGIRKPVWMDVEKSLCEVTNDELGVVSHIRGLEIYADPLMELVFYNLAENARRHGKTVTKLEALYICDGDRCILRIQGDGIGIPPENKEQIFTRGFGSISGDGLFFVHQILDLNGMSIRETGTYGDGAQFDICIPSGAFREIGSAY